MLSVGQCVSGLDGTGQWRCLQADKRVGATSCALGAGVFPQDERGHRWGLGKRQVWFLLSADAGSSYGGVPLGTGSMTSDMSLWKRISTLKQVLGGAGGWDRG